MLEIRDFFLLEKVFGGVIGMGVILGELGSVGASVSVLAGFF